MNWSLKAWCCFDWLGLLYDPDDSIRIYTYLMFWNQTIDTRINHVSFIRSFFRLLLTLHLFLIFFFSINPTISIPISIYIASLIPICFTSFHFSRVTMVLQKLLKSQLLCFSDDMLNCKREKKTTNESHTHKKKTENTLYTNLRCKCVWVYV